MTVHHNLLPEKETEINNRMDSADSHLQSQINKMKQDHAAALAKMRADHAKTEAALRKEIKDQSKDLRLYDYTLPAPQNKCNGKDLRLVSYTPRKLKYDGSGGGNGNVSNEYYPEKLAKCRGIR